MVLGSVVLFPAMYGGLCSMCYFEQDFSFRWDVCYGNFCYTIEIVHSCVLFFFFFFSPELFKAADCFEALDV